MGDDVKSNAGLHDRLLAIEQRLGIGPGGAGSGYEDTDGDETAEGYDDMTKDELVAEAEGRGLVTSGTKAEIVERLEADDADEGEE